MIKHQQLRKQRVCDLKTESARMQFLLATQQQENAMTTSMITPLIYTMVADSGEN